MGTPAELKRKLSLINERAFARLEFDFTPIDNEIRVLTKWLGKAISLNPASDLVLEALLRFRHSTTLPNLREAQLVSYGCVEPFGRDKERLIEDAQLFPTLLASIDAYRPKPRAFRRCYRGLLSGYFSYDPDLASSARHGKSNWRTLRSYLYERLPDIQSKDIEREWVDAIIGHKNLLTSSPFDRYGLSLLSEDQSEFEETKQKLNISEASWVVAQLIIRQIEIAASQSNSAFVDHLPRLLTLISKHEVVLDRALAKLLDRCVSCENTPARNVVCNFSVTSWGNPWLQSNRARWGKVTDPARQMVADWLKLDFIRQFFGLLSENSANDKRRLKFWERYHNSIDDMYFALGSAARTNRSIDFVSLRKKMVGRVLNLNSGGSPQNNAFIMRIGDYVVVEFGISGNACFIFDWRKLPFDLDGSEVAGDKTELKHDRHVERLLHKDSNAGRWEQLFEATLKTLLSVKPASEHTTIRTPISSAARNRQQSDASAERRARYTRNDLEGFCAKLGLKLRDLTAQRGNLWVLTDQSKQSVNRQLLAWGFQYKLNKGWWREKP